MLIEDYNLNVLSKSSHEFVFLTEDISKAEDSEYRNILYRKNEISAFFEKFSWPKEIDIYQLEQGYSYVVRQNSPILRYPYNSSTDSVKSIDPVNNPSHYNIGKIEVIDVIEDWQLNFHLGNAVKYIARAGKKDPSKHIEDLKKALWYLDREIKRLELK